ncbi:unnamed protein product [Amoebophrya sp. A25]|nr:unnamed protein product [Amoebophrya sp. A25]|eukprot:GSA25T00021004001.1
MQRANPNQNAGAPARRRLRNNPSDEAAKEIATMVRLEATPSVLFALREVFRSCQRNRNRAVQCVLHPPPVGMRSPPEQVIQAQMREYSTKARELSSIVSGGRMVEELASNGGLDQFTTQENELISTALQNRALAQTTRAAAGRMMRGISRTAALTANAANVLILELAAVVCLFTGVVVARNERGAPMDLYSFYQWLECNMADLAPLSILHEFYMATEHLVRTGQIHTLQLLREQVVQGEPANSILRKYFDDFQYVQMISGAILKISEDKFLNIVVDFTNQIVDMAGMTRGEAMQCLADSRWEFLVKLIQKSLEASSSFRVEFAEQPYRLIAPEVKEWWEIVCNGLNLTLGHPLLLGLNHVFKVKIPDGVTMKNRYVSKELDKTMPQGRLRRKLTAAMDKAHQNDLLVYNAKVNALVQQLKNEDMQNFMDESKYFENFGADGAMGLKEVSTYIVGLRDIVRGNLDDSTGHQEDSWRLSRSAIRSLRPCGVCCASCARQWSSTCTRFPSWRSNRPCQVTSLRPSNTTTACVLLGTFCTWSASPSWLSRSMMLREFMDKVEEIRLVSKINSRTTLPWHVTTTMPSTLRKAKRMMRKKSCKQSQRMRNRTMMMTTRRMVMIRVVMMVARQRHLRQALPLSRSKGEIFASMIYVRL